ncbi:tRNA(m5U54)methyltransferase [Coemansia linderi]|uniref:tRNA(M5U54)methyltransferase n=1 Tax=Coemansia linderi TaxID=2663919 RepID=A0ACC1KLH8_9FUNG|nr:tRNA(m5U54)methyltransferase [Coemansia linderi]
MPEGLPSGCMPEGVADSGFKRAASPAPGSNPDMSDGWRALAQPLPSEPEQKRAKLTRGDKRKAQGVRKANADETVLDAVELFLRSVWLEGHPEAEASSVPKTFGWSETSKQGEAEFCRAAPIPAKLAGGAEADCEFDVFVHELTERGVGIATRETLDEVRTMISKGSRPWVFTAPFTLRGERVRVRSVRHEWGYTQSDTLSISEQSPLRIDAPCQYFGKCSGCHLQHVAYGDQLEFKRQVVERALVQANPLFAKLAVSSVSPSPLPFGYRTKLTPHFDIRKDTPPDQVAIGFAMAGQRRVLDIEDCMIGTDAVRLGAKQARKDARAKMSSFKRGATLLVRETNVPKDDPQGDVSSIPAADLVKDYVLDFKGWVTDVVGELKFRYPASSFFQNNASILPAFTGYVRDELNQWSRRLAAEGGPGELRHLIDAYCGSGLFGIACHAGFDKVLGIEISNESISCANDNAKMNGIDNCDFLLGDASKLFDKVDTDPRHTAVIIDPPRKGSNPDFLDQLVAYGPRVIVYIACGVPAQARDINHMFSRGAISIDGAVATVETKPSSVYEVVSIQPFDLFPQTYHVENIVTLVRKE